MPCLPLPSADIPTPPSGISFTVPSLGAQSIDAALCCKLPPLPATPAIKPPIPGIVLNAGVITAVDNVLNQIEAFVDSLPLSCPKE